MSFLEFHDNMYLDTVTDNDCLVVASRGIGIEQLLVRLCRTYSDDTNLVLVVGTGPDDELFVINQMIDEKDIPYGKLPRRITAESSNTTKRKDIYLEGGVLFITERILVVDLLCDRVPIELVTGIIVYRAHRVHTDCLMAFILRLFRMKNKKGFIKALSQNPQAFFGDFGKLDKIMRKMFTTVLHLWPRFHASVQSSLGAPKTSPDVVEISLPMTQTMKNIQLDIMELIDICLKELARTNTAFLYDSDELTVENALRKSFDKSIKNKFDSIWHQLSPNARRFISDIQWLSKLLKLLTQSDVVTFYNQTRAAQNSVRVGRDVSDWIFWRPATRLFKLSKERLYPDNSSIENFEAETNLKWKAFQDLIDEIDRETADIKDTINVFIIVANDSEARLLQAILAKGASNVLRERVERYNAIMKTNVRTADAFHLFGLNEDGEQDARENDCLEPPVKRRFRTKENPAAEKIIPEVTVTLTQIVRRMKENDEQLITIEDSSDDEAQQESGGFDIEAKKFKAALDSLRPEKIHRLKLHYCVTQRQHRVLFELMLRDLKPMHIIMYDHDMHSVRQVEIYQALHCHPKRCKLYMIHYENSADMQEYYNSLRREKEAFESLIKEKASMVIPRGRDGRTEGHPDLVRGDFKANETTDSNNTRRAGGQIDRSEIIKQKVLVDMREFRCELPSIIHKRGMDIEPIQLEIGDYILSSDTCVERKSISDLIQSLQSGRLYNQANVMIRHFKRAILLIEFDGNKSFHFKGRYWGGYGGYRGPRKDGALDLIEKLILLTTHHPSLKLVWSPSTHFTAELFEYLKVDKDQPDAAKIAAISSVELPAETFEDHYDVQVREFLLKLPGVNTRNVYSIMNAAPTLAHLIELSVEELHEVLGNSRSAELFYQSLHSSLRSIANEAIRSEKESKKTRLFSCMKRRKGIL